MTDGGVLHVRVRAAPADGAANKAALRTIAKMLDIAPSRIELVSGASSRIKRVALEVDQSTISTLWPTLLTREL